MRRVTYFLLLFTVYVLLYGPTTSLENILTTLYTVPIEHLVIFDID